MHSERLKFRFPVRIITFIMVGYWTMPFFFNISLQIITKFLASSVSFDIDTNFLNWNTTFPAVTICEAQNIEQVKRVRNQYFENNSIYPMDNLISDIVFFHGTCGDCENCILETCPENLIYEAANMRLKCHELIFNCAYGEEFFSCCDVFKPIATEYGICYAFNSNQAESAIEHQRFMNRSTGTVNLLFEINSYIEVFVHGVNEVPNFYSHDIIIESLQPGVNKELFIQLMEVHNDYDVVDLTVELRRCRFERETVNWQNMQNIYPFYSYSSCIVECTLQMHMEFCNCTHHYLSNALKSRSTKNFNATTICDYNGLACLSKNYEYFKERTKSCFCLSSCTETEFDTVFSSAYNEETEEGHVIIGILDLPKERYVRHVQRNYLDLLISFGSLMGLFFNASLVRIMEIIFEIFLSIYYLVKKLFKFRHTSL